MASPAALANTPSEPRRARAMPVPRGRRERERGRCALVLPLQLVMVALLCGPEAGGAHTPHARARPTPPVPKTFGNAAISYIRNSTFEPLEGAAWAATQLLVHMGEAHSLAARAHPGTGRLGAGVLGTPRSPQRADSAARA